MANITLPSVTSQARVIQPLTPSSEKPNTLQAIISAAPSLANSFIRASEVANNAKEKEILREQQEALNTQKVEDQNTLASAISDTNILLGQREAAQVAETSLQSLAIDVNRAWEDGKLSDSEKGVQQTFINTFEKVKNARNQGLLNDNTFSIKAREAKQVFIAQYPHLAPDIDKVFNAATGRSSSTTTGAAAQKQLAFNQKMENTYGSGYSAQDVLVEQAKSSQIANLERNRDLGVVSFGQLVSDSNSALNLGIDSISQQATTMYSGKQALDQNDLDTLNTKTENIRRTIVRGIDQEVAQLRASGQVVDPASVRAHKEYSLKQLDDTQAFYQDKDLQKVMGKRNETEKAMWQAGLGGQITKLNSVAGLLGNGGLTALSGFIGASTPAQEQMIASLAQGSGLSPEALANSKSLVLEAAVRVANPESPPGFEKLDAFYGLGAMRAGKTSPTVQENTLLNLDKLVVNPQDVSGSITQLNDPKISAGYAAGTKETQAKLVNTANNWESLVTNEIQSGGYSATFDNQTQSFVVSRPEPVNPGFFTPQELGLTSEKPRTRVIVNRGLTKTMNDLLKFHGNPNYAGIVQPRIQWLSDMSNLLQPQPAE